MHKHLPQKEDYATRDRRIVRAGIVDIATNFVLAGFKIVVGIISNSIAITTDAVHGLVDAISGLIVIASSKIATHQRGRRGPDRAARVERTASLLISLIVIIVGVTALVESLEKVLEPEPVDYSAPTIVVLVASVLAKLLLGLYLKRTGRAVSSDVLTASGTEAFNDFLLSTAILVSALIFLIWHVDVEAYVSVAISLVIIKLGLELIWPLFRRKAPPSAD